MPVEASRGVPWTLLTYGANRAITVLTTLVLARMLAPADFGLFAMATVGMELLSVFSGLWLGAALIVRRDMDERAQGTVLTLLIGAGALLALALLVLAPAAAAFFGEPRLAGIVALLAVVLLISGVSWFYETVLQRELAFRRRFACQVVRTIAFSAVALALAASGAGVWSLILAYVAGNLANAVALLAVTPCRVRPAFDRAEARRIVRSGRGFLGQDLAGFVSENADYLAIGRILGPAQLGVYAMAYRQAAMTHYAIAEPVGKVTFPAFAQMRHRGEDVRPAFLNVLQMVALAVCPIGVILSAAAVPFTIALLGEDWRAMAAPLAVLGIWAVLRPLQATVGNLLNSLGRAHIYGRVAMISLVPLVAATFVAAHLGGATAVAWMLVVHMGATLAVLAVAAAREARVRLGALVAGLWPFAAASAAAWPVAHSIAALDGPSPPVVLVAAAGGCLVAYAAALAALAPGVLGAAAAGARRMLASTPREPRLRRRRSPVPALALLVAALAGALGAWDPKLALGLAGGGVLLALPFVAPIAHVLVLVTITAIVPFDAQNAVAFGGGAGSPGLFPTDLLLAGGLVRAGLVLLDTPLERRPKWALGLVLVFLAAAVGQAVHGLRSGSDVGTAGAELRVLLGFGAAVIALPVLAYPVQRARLLRGLVGVGLAIGLWGIAQWAIDIPFTAAEDAGVREGVRLTTAGRGQLQGGLFAFPVVVVMGMAALLSHQTRSRRARWALVAMVALSAVDLLLTYERTFWVATLFALVFVALKAAPRQRLRALTLGTSLLALVLGGMAVVAPRDFTAARERLLSLAQYSDDLSVRFRVTETRSVTERIEAHPLFGSGLGATMLWGRAYEGVRPTTESFAHNGYLWLTWKLGAMVAALLVLLLAIAVLSRGPPTTTTFGAVRAGAQAGLLVLLVASVTFPAFNALGITAVMGVLVALCSGPPRSVSTA